MHAEINGKRIEHGQQADYTVYYHYAHVNAAQETHLCLPWHLSLIMQHVINRFDHIGDSAGGLEIFGFD